MNEYEYTLLNSVRERPRHLSMGHTPVDAITVCFKLIDDGLVILADSEYHTDLVMITEKGKQALLDYERDTVSK